MKLKLHILSLFLFFIYSCGECEGRVSNRERGSINGRIKEAKAIGNLKCYTTATTREDTLDGAKFQGHLVLVREFEFSKNESKSKYEKYVLFPENKEIIVYSNSNLYCEETYY